MLKHVKILSLVLLSVVIGAIPASAGAIRTFSGFQPATLSRGDDVSSAATPLGFSANFLGPTSSTVFVNTNGNVTFGAPFVGYPGMPNDNEAGGVIPPLSSSTARMISAFLADIDTSAPSTGTITYGSTTLNGRPAFVATYSNVTHFSWSAAGFDTTHNSFQIILLDRGDTGIGNFDIEFNYDKIEWETADSNGGVNGFGGYSAQVGYTNGSRLPGTFFELTGSETPGSFLNGSPLSLVAGSQNSGGVAGRYVFAIRNGVPATPTITSLSPSSATTGGPSFNLTVNGSGFASNSTIMWSGAPLATTFISANQLMATVAASRIASQGTFLVTVNTGGSASNSAGFTVTAAVAATISSVSPTIMQAGGGAFSLTVNGSGFAGNSTILWNGSPLPTTFGSSIQLTGAVSSSLIANQGSATVAVSTGGSISNSVTLTIAPATPTISSISPTTAQAGAPSFALIVNGSRFSGNSTILWNGSPLQTSFGSANQLVGTVPANLIAAVGTATVTVTANGTVSNSSSFTITQGTGNPSISSLSPSSAQAGGAAFSLIVSGSGFSANSTVLWNGSPLPTTFGGSNQLIGGVAASLLTAPGAVTVTVSTNGAASNTSTFTITSGSVTPTISSISPTTAQAGGPTFTLTVNGSGFAANSTILWNGSAVPTAFIGSGQLMGTVVANLIAAQGSATVAVATNGTVSNNSTFTITTATITSVINSISPSAAQAGGASFALTVNGSGFAANSTISWNGSALPTAFGNANQLTGTVVGSLIAAQGTATVAVSTNGSVSNSSTFTITAAAVIPVISSISPSIAQANGPAFALTVNGSGFAANSTILWNGAPLPTTFGNATLLTGAVGSSQIGAQGAATVTVSTNGVVSNSSIFTIAPAVATVTSISPSSVQAGAAAFTVTVNGTGFSSNSVILWNGGPVQTTLVSPTQVSGPIGANLLTTQGTVIVSVSNSGTVSNTATFTITPGATISNLNPSSAPAGGSAFTLTVNGSGFNANSAIVWNGSPLATFFVNNNQLTGTVDGSLIAAQGTATVTVNTNGVASNGLAFTISNGAVNLTITSLNPSIAQAGAPALTLTVNGTGFTAASTIQWNGVPLPTTFVGATQLTTTVAASLIAAQGTAAVTVGTNGAVSNSSIFTIGPATPAITSLNPATAQAGGAAFTITVNGSGFAANSVILWNGSPVVTFFGNANQLTGTIDAGLILTQGAATVTVSTNALVSNGSTFTISPGNSTPAISSLSPAIAQAGGTAFTLTVNGSGFTNNSTILWNGSPLSTSFVSAIQLTGSVDASLIAAQSTATITVRTNSAVSNSSTFTIGPATPSISGLSPSSTAAGGAAFTLTVNGSAFAANSTILWNGSPLATIFGSATQLSGIVDAALITTPGTITITVNTAGAASNSSTFTISPASGRPAISSLSPSSVQAGGAAFTLTVNGSGFAANSTISWNSQPLATIFGNATQLTGIIDASLIAAQGTAAVTVSTGGTVSNSSVFTISGTATPAISSLTPSTTPAGGPSFNLTVNGSGFAANSTILWNESPLATVFNNATQLTGIVDASLIAAQGTVAVTVNSNGTVSNNSVFTISAPTPNPTITTISPATAQVGGTSFTLTVTGTRFAANSTILWNGSPLATTFGNAAQLTGTVDAGLIAAEGIATITVSTNGAVSNSSVFTISSTTPKPAISTLSPSSTQAGGAAFTLTLNGSAFVASSTILWNGSPLATIFGDATQLTGIVDASLIATSGTATITVNTNGAVSNSAVFTILSGASASVISSLSPSSSQAGGAAFSLTVNGAGFAATSTVLWNGVALPTTFVDATQLTAAVAAPLIATQGTAAVTVNTSNTISNSSTFTIGAGVSVITGLNPSSSLIGGAAFSLTVNGSGFAANSIIMWNGAALPTTFVSATQLTGGVAASLITSAGTALVTVSTNGTVTNGSPFVVLATVTAPLISGLTPSSSQAGGAAFTLAVNGFAFTEASAVLWNDTPLLTTFVSANQLKASISADLISIPGTAAITVSAAGKVTNRSPFSITAAAPGPVLTSISPTSIASGSPSFTLTVNGSAFVASSGLSAGSTVLWNGTPVQTTFVSATQLSATIDATLIGPKGVVSVSVSSSTNSLAFAVLSGPAQQLSVFPAELHFAGLAGGPSPVPANLSVWSQGAPVKFHVAGTTGTWLDVNLSAGQTNQGVAVTPNTKGMTAGGYRGELLIQNDAKPTEMQSIPVTLTLAPSSDPQLEIAPLNQTIEMTKGAPPAQYNLIVSNSGGGKLSFIGQTMGGDWLDLQTTYGSALPSSPSSLSYTLDPAGLAAGIYNAGIIVTDINSNQRLTAQITLIVSERRSSITVSQSAMEFSLTPQQAAAQKTFGIRNDGADPVSVSVESETRSGGAGWLSTTPQLSSATLPAGAIAKVSVVVNPQGLAAGLYYGLVRIKAGANSEAVQSIPVVLSVQQGAQIAGRVTPAGITVVGNGGATIAQIQLSNPTANPVDFSSVPGVEWLSVKPATGTIPPFQTLSVDVTANSAKVALGFHSEVIRIPFSDGVISTLNVLAVMTAGPPPTSVVGAALTACVPTNLGVQLTSLEPGFTITAGSVATIQAKVLDNCGSSRPSSTLIARISGELNPVVLSYEDEGVWSGSWSPAKIQSSVTVTVAAAYYQSASTLTGQTTVAGTVVAVNTGTAPTMERAVNAAGLQSGGQISPGAWISIFGNQLADGEVVATGRPNPTELGGTRVTLGGTRLPLLFVNPKQLNAFVPFTVTPNTLQQLIIERGSTVSIPFKIKVADAFPGIYTSNQTGSGQGTVVFAGTQVLAGPISVGRPAHRGDRLEIYATGLGLVANSPADGQTASTTAISATVNPVTVTISGVPTPAQFAGLTPGFVGLYQINVQVPDDVQTGGSIPLSLTVAGKESNTVTIAIE